MPTSDILIIGGGLAGLFCALKLAPRPVTVLATAPLGEGASSALGPGRHRRRFGGRRQRRKTRRGYGDRRRRPRRTRHRPRHGAGGRRQGRAICSPTACPSTRISKAVSCNRARRRIRSGASCGCAATWPAARSCRRSSPRCARRRRSPSSKNSPPKISSPMAGGSSAPSPAVPQARPKNSPPAQPCSPPAASASSIG